MDEKKRQPSNSKTSLRNPLAALSMAHEALSQSEPNAQNRLQRRRVATKLRDLASKELP